LRKWGVGGWVGKLWGRGMCIFIVSIKKDREEKGADVE
jgi:hypothetical protein